MGVVHFYFPKTGTLFIPIDIKSELIHHERFKGPQDTLRAIFEYIEIFYNRKRKHSTLGYQTPSQFERTMKSAVCF